MSIQNNLQKQIAVNKADELSGLKSSIIQVLEKQKDELKKALPDKNVPVERVIRIISTALTLNPTLLRCTPQSILGCAIQSAQLGLFPDNILGQCYFVPYYFSNEKKYKAQLIVGYRGYIDLMYRSNMVKSVYADVVRNGDYFEFEYGSNQRLVHIPKPKDKAVWKMEDIAYSYAYIYTTNGGFIFTVLDHNELQIIRSYSKTREEKSAWGTNPNMMAMKSAIRRVNRYTPLSVQLRQVDMLESMLESEQGQEFDEIIEEEVAEKILEKPEITEPEVVNGDDNAGETKKDDQGTETDTNRNSIKRQRVSGNKTTGAENPVENSERLFE